MELGCCCCDWPGKSECAGQEDDAECNFCSINRVGNDAFDALAEGQGQRQCAGIEPRKVRKIDRAHTGEQIIGTEIEPISEMQDGLSIPSCPLAVRGRVQGTWNIGHSGDHQSGENRPGHGIWSGANDSRHCCNDGFWRAASLQRRYTYMLRSSTAPRRISSMTAIADTAQ